MNRSRKMLLSVAVVLGVAAVFGAGTFASFNAQTKNPDNTFASGTLVLSNTKSGGSACMSTGAGTNTDTNVNGTCDTLIDVSVQKPGDSSSTNLTIKNEGSLAASTLKVFSAACANADAGDESYHGTGLPCGKVQLYIQRYTDAAFTIPAACVYGASTLNICDFSDETKTLSAFQSAYGSSGSGLSIGSLGAGSSNYFKVAVKLPSSADNTFQGREATFDLTWFAAQ